MVTTKRFYIAGSFKQLPTITAVATNLVAQGLTQTYDWTKVKPTPDLAALREIATAEYAGVTACDCFVFIFPGGKGANVEFGIATALNKPIYMLDTTNQRLLQVPFIVWRMCISFVVQRPRLLTTLCNWRLKDEMG
ncbi:nucleoside 2-deoxyribosyltransferase [Lactiplantibacillus daowaiensis]|uniref:Nucleoside 2-deoxyribosyltransferase n=1 Tax=Lactiplantibacillus daowaiensis TaxID=2559918 RepID=A0ABW1S3U9_9LACO